MISWNWPKIKLLERNSQSVHTTNTRNWRVLTISIPNADLDRYKEWSVVWITLSSCEGFVSGSRMHPPCHLPLLTAIPAMAATPTSIPIFIFFHQGSELCSLLYSISTCTWYVLTVCDQIFVGWNFRGLPIFNIFAVYIFVDPPLILLSFSLLLPKTLFACDESYLLIRVKVLQCFSMTPVLLTAILVTVKELDLNFRGLKIFAHGFQSVKTVKVSSRESFSAYSM